MGAGATGTGFGARPATDTIGGPSPGVEAIGGNGVDAAQPADVNAKTTGTIHP